MNIPLEVIRCNGGFFTRREALAWGETDLSLRNAVRDGLINRLRHGAYAVAETFCQLNASQQHLVYARAAQVSQRAGAALTGPSAAVFHGFAVWGHDLDVVHLLRVGSGKGRRQAGVVHHVHQASDASGVQTFDGVLAVDPARAAWETARLSTLEGAVVTLDCALHADPGLLAPLRELAARHSSHPGSRTARQALRMARGKSESPGESLTRVACFRQGIPEPDLQFDVFDGSGHHLGRTDFVWEAHRHVAEFDGKVKYERLVPKGDTASNVVVREKAREDSIRGMGYGMTRLTWSEVQPRTAGRGMERLAADLERSRRLYAGAWSAPRNSSRT